MFGISVEIYNIFGDYHSLNIQIEVRDSGSWLYDVFL